MKAAQYDGIRLLVDLRSIFRNRLIPRGTEGTIVECFEQPKEGYYADFPVPDSTVVGDETWEMAEVNPDQFEVVRRHKEEPTQEDQQLPAAWRRCKQPGPASAWLVWQTSA